MKLHRVPVSLVLALALTLGSMAVQAVEGADGGFFSGEAVHGIVADAQTGEPIEGAVIVARWESLVYQHRFEGSGYVRGEPLQVEEAVSDAHGRYAIRGWGPRPRIGVLPDDHADPLLAVFKAGYEPLVLRNEAWKDWSGHNPAQRRASEWDGRTIRLTPWKGPAPEYAALIARFQGGYPYGGLDWMHKDVWKAMPRMVLALHQEKRRLGHDGMAIEGVDRMPGRSGAGTLVDESTGNAAVIPAPYRPIISTAWTLRRIGGSETRRYVQQEATWADFHVSAWRLPAPALPAGWDFAFDVPPKVTIYAVGYHRVAGVVWPEAGMAVKLRKLALERDVELAELRAWREDLDREMAATADRNEAIAGLGELILRLVDQCRTLVPDAREGICLDPGAQLVQQARSLRASRVTSPRPDNASYGASGVVGARQPAPPPVGAPFANSDEMVPRISIEPIGPASSRR